MQNGILIRNELDVASVLMKSNVSTNNGRVIQSTIISLINTNDYILSLFIIKNNVSDIPKFVDESNKWLDKILSINK